VDNVETRIGTWEGIGVDDNRRRGQYLGTAFLVVWAGSILSGTLSVSIFSDNTSDTLENIAANSAQMRWSTMIELCVTSVGIVVLAVLLYMVVRTHNPVAALVALGWWLAEAVTLAVSTIGAFLLIPLSERFAAADAVGSSELLALGETLQGFDREMWEIHMVFYGLGALVFYSLLYRARSVPRWLSGFGVAAVAIGLFSSVLFLAVDVDWFFLGFPTGVFELLIGIWLIVKGISHTQVDDVRWEPAMAGAST
jgi:MFS family permease